MFRPITLGFLLREYARTQKIWMIFQPASPFLLHKNKQGAHYYLVPCLFIRNTRVHLKDFSFSVPNIQLTLFCLMRMVHPVGKNISYCPVSSGVHSLMEKTWPTFVTLQNNMFLTSNGLPFMLFSQKVSLLQYLYPLVH